MCNILLSMPIGYYPYPIQMASIKKNCWRLGEHIDKGLKDEELKKKKSKLWQQIEKIAKESAKPPLIHPYFPKTKLLGYGWEWAVYKLPTGNQVVKVPSGTFKEVNESEYLENTKYAYEICKKHLKGFVVNTTFERILNSKQKLNTLKQRLINGQEVYFIDPQTLSEKLRKNLSKLAKGMLGILKEYDWIPDMHLDRKKVKDRKGWNVWNLMIENDKPVIFDFTAYYDVWRLYPQRTKEERKIKGKNWQEFLFEMSENNRLFIS